MQRTIEILAGDEIFAGQALRRRAQELDALGTPEPDDPDHLTRHRSNFRYIAERLRALATQIDPRGESGGWQDRAERTP